MGGRCGNHVSDRLAGTMTQQLGRFVVGRRARLMPQHGLTQRVSGGTATSPNLEIHGSDTCWGYIEHVYSRGPWQIAWFLGQRRPRWVKALIHSRTIAVYNGALPSLRTLCLLFRKLDGEAAPGEKDNCRYGFQIGLGDTRLSDEIAPSYADQEEYMPTKLFKRIKLERHENQGMLSVNKWRCESFNSHVLFRCCDRSSINGNWDFFLKNNYNSRA